jgi:hypothetical protein
MRRVFTILAFACASLLSGCSSLPGPGRAYDPKLFAVEPVIIQRGERLYLRYRMSLEKGQPLRMHVIVKKEETKGVAYFTVPVSWPEYGALEEIPLYPNQVEEFAKSGRFFWRDPDGTERPLKTIKEE